MKRTSVLAIIATLIFSFVLGMGAYPQTTAQASTNNQVGVGRIRFGNATVTGSPLRITMDDRSIANKVYDLAGYFSFNSGDHTVVFRTEGGAELARTTVTLEPAKRMTVTLVGTNENPQIVVTNDDASPTVRNETRVRVLNGVEGSSPADVTFNGESKISSLAYGSASDEIVFQAGSYSIALGDKAAANVVLLPGRYYLLSFVGGDDTSSPRFISWIGRPYRVAGFNRFRFMNLVDAPEGEDDPVYSVFVNNDPIAVYQNVQFGEATNEVVIQPGSYLFEVYTQGQTPDSAEPITTLQIDIAQDQSIFIIANGQPGDVSLNIFSDDVSPVPVNTARLQVINLATAIPEFAVVGPNNVNLVDEAPYASLVANNIPGGAYKVTLADASDTSRTVGQAEVNAPSGNLSTLIVYGTDTPRWAWFNEGLNQVAVARIVHASASVGDVDIYLNGELTLSNFAYKDTTDYLTLDPGGYELTVYPAGTDVSVEGVTPLWRDNLNITGNALAFTLVAMGQDNFRVNVYADNLELIPDGQARVRFVNGVRNIEQVSFINAANAGVLAGGLQFGQGTDNLNLDANTRTFNVSNVGVGVFYRVESFALVPGAYYSFIVIGDATDPTTVEHILLERLP